LYEKDFQVIIKSQGAALKLWGMKVKPQGSTLKPRGADLKPQGTDLKPWGMKAKSQGADLNPWGVEAKLQGTGLKPWGVKAKPRGAETKPQGADLNPWGDLCEYFKHSPEIRRVIHTANAIESLNYQLRKVTKNRPTFSTDDAIFKILYLVIRNAPEKRTMPIKNWGLALNQVSYRSKEKNGFRSDGILPITQKI
jgi:hypothetical protein